MNLVAYISKSLYVRLRRNLPLHPHLYPHPVGALAKASTQSVV